MIKSGKYSIIVFGLVFGLCLSCQNQKKHENLVRNSELLILADSLYHYNPGRADSLYRIILDDSAYLDATTYANTLLGLSLIYSNRSTFDTAVNLLDKASEIATQKNDTSLILKCLLLRGNLFLNLGNFEQSGHIFGKGLALATKSKNSDSQQDFFLRLGEVQNFKGDYSTAAKYYTESLKIGKQSGDEQKQAKALANLAMTLVKTADYSEAIRYMNKALVINRKLNLKREYAVGIQNLGVIYRNAGNSDSAIVFYRQAYQIMSELKDSLNMVLVRYNIGNILKNQQKFDEAEKEMNSIIQFCEQKNITEGQVYALSALASIYDQTARSAQALQAIDNAISKSKHFQLYANLSAFYERKQQILAGLGRFDEAYTTVLISRDLADSLLSLEKQNEIAALKIRYETERKEDENALLKKDNEVQKSRLWLLRLGLILGTIVFVFVVYIMLVRQKQIKQQKILSDEKSSRMEQEKRNQEIEFEKIQIEKQIHEQELVYQSLVRTDLIHINRSVKEKLMPFRMLISRKKDQEYFAQVLSDLTRDASKDPMAEFELVFKQLHSTFFEKLLSISPELSKTELQVSALIRLNLSTKDIARLTNLNIATIEITRHHIRKKLNLSQSDTLTTFLISI